MPVISPTTFGILLWGAVMSVAIVFLYELYAISLEYGGRPGA